MLCVAVRVAADAVAPASSSSALGVSALQSSAPPEPHRERRTGSSTWGVTLCSASSCSCCRPSRRSHRRSAPRTRHCSHSPGAPFCPSRAAPHASKDAWFGGQALFHVKHLDELQSRAIGGVQREPPRRARMSDSPTSAAEQRLQPNRGAPTSVKARRDVSRETSSLLPPDTEAIAARQLSAAQRMHQHSRAAVRFRSPAQTRHPSQGRG